MGLLLMNFLISSCSKDETSTKEENPSTSTTTDKVVTSQQVADVTTNAVAPASYGLQSSITKALQTAVDNKIYASTQASTCGITISNNYTVAQASNGYAYKYSVSGNYQTSCVSTGAPAPYNYKLNMEGSYETPKMSSSDKAEADLTFTSVESSTTNVLGSGTYNRNGSQTFKDQSQPSFTSTIQITLSNLLMNKTTTVIISGSGTAKISITAAGVTKNYTGELTFKGNGLAVLVIDGVSYNITL